MFFDQYGLISHQINSYNQFITSGLRVWWVFAQLRGAVCVGCWSWLLVTGGEGGGFFAPPSSLGVVGFCCVSASYFLMSWLFLASCVVRLPHGGFSRRFGVRVVFVFFLNVARKGLVRRRSVMAR